MADKQTTKKVKDPCLKCKKSVTKTSRSVQCKTCRLWIHAVCLDTVWISDELFSILEDRERYQAVSWSCDSCLASAGRLEDSVLALEGRIKAVESATVKTTETVRDLDRRVERVETANEKVEDKIQDMKEVIRRELYMEMRERKQRQKNVVLHRVGEAGEEVRTAEERMTWDMDSCDNIFKTMKTTVSSRTALKFCRRIGEKGENPRPMVIGFRHEKDKEEILQNVYKLKDTFFKEISIVPDLTKEERKEEVDMLTEAENNNKKRTEDDISKNLSWMVVGRRGERRLIKGIERTWEQRAGAGRGRGRTTGGGLGATTGGDRGAWL